MISILSGSGSGDEGDTSSLEKLLANWFCFVQTEDGKVVEVYHPKDELPDIANFKKSIAAAFQANFKGTEEETEVDPQSVHMAHYRYQLQQ